MMMTEKEIIDLNLKRIRIKLKDIFEHMPLNPQELLSSMKVLRLSDKKQISLTDVDFGADCVFICKERIIGVVSYLGMIKLNNIDLKDNTLAGERSRIKVNYMLANAVNAKLAFVSDGKADSSPDLNVHNYLKKDLVIWALPKILGTGTEKDEKTSVNSLLSLYEQRRWAGKLSWLFFWGSPEEYQKIYALDTLNDIYYISFDKVVSVQEKSTTLW